MKNNSIKKLINEPEILIMPGVHDALSAIIKREGWFQGSTRFRWVLLVVILVCLM